MEIEKTQEIESMKFQYAITVEDLNNKNLKFEKKLRKYQARGGAAAAEVT
jgi:hypothetical protein